MTLPSSGSVALQAPTRANTGAVVVLFHPEGDFVGRLRRVQAQVGWLTVVSNDGGSLDRLAALDVCTLTHVQNDGNAGLAAALNTGLAHSRKRGFSWCLLLDQDTVIDDDLLEGLADAFSACPDRARIGLLAPNYRSLGGARLAYPSDVAWQTVASAVTSGTLAPLSVIDRLGGMREAFFIEGIDIEYCLRVRAAGMWVVATGRPLMTHGAGAAEERRLFGRTVLVGHHPPWRCFLQYRNLAWILLRYGRTDLRWAGLTCLNMLKRICLVTIFEQQRGAKIWAMLRGTLVGVVQALLRKEGNDHVQVDGLFGKSH